MEQPRSQDFEEAQIKTVENQKDTENIEKPGGVSRETSQEENADKFGAQEKSLIDETNHTQVRQELGISSSDAGPETEDEKTYLEKKLAVIKELEDEWVQQHGPKERPMTAVE